MKGFCMGAWGIKTFENDTALDWVAGLEDGKDVSLIEDALDLIINLRDMEVSAPAAEEALAACEIIALLQGNRDDGLDYEETEVWVKSVNFKVSNDLTEKAQRVIDRILTQPSELYDLWEETGDFEEWKNGLLDLRMRIKSPD